MDLRFRSAPELAIRATDDSASEVFPAFYDGYDRAFTLPDEKEGRDGFVECLALNHGPRFEVIAERFGPYRELVLVATLDGRDVGGANIFVTPLPAHGVVAVSLNYLFVDPGVRGRGLSRRVLDACRELAAWLFPGVGPVTVLLELNDPLRLTAEQYRQDSLAAGVDQLDRVAIWARLGARIVDFPYVQPPLSPTQSADDNLALGLIAEPGFTLTGALLADHLARFFAVSVLKTGTLTANPLAERQVQSARELDVIALFDPRPAIAEMRQSVGMGGPALRERLAQHAG